MRAKKVIENYVGESPFQDVRAGADSLLLLATSVACFTFAIVLEFFR